MLFDRSGRTGTRSRRGALAATCAVSLAGTFALAAPALAQTHQAAAKAAKNPYAQYYSALTKLENGSSGGSLNEGGSTLFQPLMAVWADSKPVGVTLNVAGGGSGAGKTGAENGTLDIGASDAYKLPSDPSTILNIPVVVSAQEIAYNVPGVSKSTHIKLNAQILNGMYSGTITTWNNNAIKKLNPSVALPSTTVVPIHRTGSSGDSFLISSYLYNGDTDAFDASTGPSTSPTWPNDSAALAEGSNQLVENACQSTSGCVAYIGSSYLRNVQLSLGTAALENGEGNYVTINNQNVLNEINSYKHVPSSGTLSLISHNFDAKAGYPIVNFEYAFVNTSSARAASVKAFLAWAMDPRKGATTANLAPFFFHPLPPNALGVAISLLNKIS